MSGTGKRKSVSVKSPGEIIKKDLHILDLSVRDLAAITHLPPGTIDGLIQQDVEISTDLAERLSTALGSSPEYWLNLDRKYRSLTEARSS